MNTTLVALTAALQNAGFKVIHFMCNNTVAVCETVVCRGRAREQALWTIKADLSIESTYSGIDLDPSITMVPNKVLSIVCEFRAARVA